MLKICNMTIHKTLIRSLFIFLISFLIPIGWAMDYDPEGNAAELLNSVYLHRFSKSPVIYNAPSEIRNLCRINSLSASSVINNKSIDELINAEIIKNESHLVVDEKIDLDIIKKFAEISGYWPVKCHLSTRFFPGNQTENWLVL